MKGIKIYISGGKPISFEKVTEYKISKNFLCMTLADGRYIAYNIAKIERFEVET